MREGGESNDGSVEGDEDESMPQLMDRLVSEEREESHDYEHEPTYFGFHPRQQCLGHHLRLSHT